MKNVLLLNADWSPIKVIPWERAVTMILDGTASSLENYEGFIRSARLALPRPAVVCLKKYQTPKGKVKFSGKNVVFRDSGRCFPVGTPILMASGEFRSIEQIRVGDRVIDAFGFPVTVTAIGSRVADTIGLRLRRAVRLPLWLTPDHPVLCPPGEIDSFQEAAQAGYLLTPRTIHLEPIASMSINMVDLASSVAPKHGRPPIIDNERVRLFYQKKIGVPLSIRVTPCLSYVMGLFCAEGSFSRDAGSTGEEGISGFQFSFSKKEKKTLAQDVTDYFKSIGLTASITDSGKNGCRVKVGSELMGKLFFRHTGEFSHAKRVPYNLIGPYHKEFLKGLFAGDAHVRLKKGELKIELRLTGKDLIRGAHGLLLGLGIHPTLQFAMPEPNSGVKRRKHTWAMILQAGVMAKFMQVVLDKSPPNSLSAEVPWGNENFVFSKVQGFLKSEGKQEVYNLETDGSHSYIAQGYSVHNCAYCGVMPRMEDGRIDRSAMTLDHVVPRAQEKNGRVWAYWTKKWVKTTSWDNAVCACYPCNQIKGDRTPEQAKMVMLWRPRTPTSTDALRISLGRTHTLPVEWRQFLPEGWHSDDALPAVLEEAHSG